MINSKITGSAVVFAGSVMIAQIAVADSHGNDFVHSRAFNGQTYVMYQDHMSLYTYDKDAPHTSNCINDCTTDWMPATLDAGTPLGENYSLFERADGTMQAAFRGQPLYRYAKDQKPGDIFGDGVDGVWRLARP